MEQFFHAWNFETDFHLSNQKKPIGPENELVELLWRDGQVVLQSQTHRNPALNNSSNEPVQTHKQDLQTLKANVAERGSLDTFLENEETVSWIQYPLEDPFEKEFSSHFFPQIPSFDPDETEKPIKQFNEEKLRSANNPQSRKINHDPSDMPPPRFKVSDSGAVTFGDCTESGVMTVGPSHCGSNQLPNDLDITTTNTTGKSIGSLKDGVGKDVSLSERRKNDALDPNSTSSSGGSSACSFGRTSKEAASGVSRHKRKCMETEESESLSEAAGNKSIHRSGSARRSRAAEVHNLSERRRRDRINEKMKALQELIPHCSRTDKASILDEAIDYLKSLQMQLQVMWMGSGMAPMLFPGVQPYLTRMGMQIPQASPLPSSIENPMHFPRLPLLNQPTTQNPRLVRQNPVMNPVHFQNQTQNLVFPEQFARYIGGFHQMQAASQPMNMLRFGSQTSQQSQMSAPATIGGGVTGPVTGGAATYNLPSST